MVHPYSKHAPLTGDHHPAGEIISWSLKSPCPSGHVCQIKQLHQLVYFCCLQTSSSYLQISLNLETSLALDLKKPRWVASNASQRLVLECQHLGAPPEFGHLEVGWPRHSRGPCPMVQTMSYPHHLHPSFSTSARSSCTSLWSSYHCPKRTWKVIQDASLVHVFVSL
jgi:hypothetical protein